MYKCAMVMPVITIWWRCRTPETSTTAAKGVAIWRARSVRIRPISPPNHRAKRAGELNLPILLIHGKSDWRAPIEQYKAMEDALKATKKPFESMLRSNEGHGFYDASNRVELYKRMETFLLKYNPAELNLLTLLKEPRFGGVSFFDRAQAEETAASRRRPITSCVGWHGFRRNCARRRPCRSSAPAPAGWLRRLAPGPHTCA